MHTIAEALKEAENTLCSHDAPALDAQVLLSHVLRRPRSFLMAWPDRALSPAQRAQFERLVAARAAGQPVAYLTGRREFWSLPLAVTDATLIPRPETELLVERALVRMTARGGTAADLGTGSGAVALALASERPDWQLVATDTSDAALAVALANARRLELDNVAFRAGSWCAALGDERFAVIVSNPPYVRTNDPHLRQGDVRFEPRDALVSGAAGLDAIRHIGACACAHLERGGWLLLEHGADQGTEVAALLRELGYRQVCGHSDLAGRDRVTEGRWRP